jgi:hypothetical protein
MTTLAQLRPKTNRPRHRSARQRDGSVTLEFLLVLPVLLIVLLAVVEFGMFFANMQQVALASRVGTESASQANLGGSFSGDPIPPTVLQAINAQLETSGISPCRIYLQHNVTGSPQVLVEDYVPGFACPAPTAPLPPQPPPATNYGRLSVRVTVCVPMTELTPNCLALLGFDLAGRCAICSTTFRHEG